jgi:hypothetical protein
LNASEFIRKWTDAELSERSACQQHFLDLCDLVDHPKPAEVDKTGESFGPFDALFATRGWPPDLTDEQILERLLELNLERTGGC